MSNEKKQRHVRTIAKSKLELFVTNVNGWKPLTFVTNSSILDFAVVTVMSLKGALLIIRATSSKAYLQVTEQKNCTLINIFSQEPETFVSVFTANSLNLRLYSLHLVSHEKYVSNLKKYVFYIF